MDCNTDTCTARRMVDAWSPEPVACLKAENPAVHEDAVEWLAVHVSPPVSKAHITLTVRLKPDVAAALTRGRA